LSKIAIAGIKKDLGIYGYQVSERGVGCGIGCDIGWPISLNQREMLYGFVGHSTISNVIVSD
jgi:hypothetical protein